jgi:pimeloyl-ACP methyl ester carboxylesterase
MISQHYITLGEGQDTDPILLLHANAYNPYMYEEFVAALGNPKTIAPMHRPLYDDKVMTLYDWSIFADDLIQFMDSHRLKNVKAIGHSLGGIAIWKASTKRPDLFKSIILLDPVILPEKVVKWVKLVPFFLKKRIRPIIKIAANRRHHWTSRTEAKSHLIGKSVFKSLKPSVFETFIEKGIIEDQINGGVKLAFPRAWEAMIYASPENTWKWASKTKTPITIIKAQHSNIITNETWQKMKNSYGSNYTLVEMNDVGHLIPFEKPQELALFIKPFISF